MSHEAVIERLLTCTEVDRVFRLRKGTAREAAAAGLVPCAKRERGGKETFLIDPADARAEWGVS